MAKISEKIEFITKTLVLSNTGLCQILGVPDDEIDCIKNGELKSTIQVEKIDRLFGIARSIENSNVMLTPYLFQRRKFRGRTIIDLLKSLKTEDDAINEIISILHKEADQHNKVQTRLRNRTQSLLPVSAYAKPHLTE